MLCTDFSGYGSFGLADKNATFLPLRLSLLDLHTHRNFLQQPSIPVRVAL